METLHKLHIADSRNLSSLKHNSVDLVVTSPPYPMIQMWDHLFSEMSENIKECLTKEQGDTAFEKMHQELDKVWAELYRVVKQGSFVCINIGDATRTMGNTFQLYSNHTRIISSMKKIGFETLPVILWRKQTNAPNKFMGSGMLPAGAYVTLEHEYILLFRKGNKREFRSDIEKKKRMESAFFWEERNIWFSDLWDFKGASQILNNKELRNRSAAYPFELVYRLVNMYSLQGDTVLDPFLGTGTTTYASMAAGRNSIGIEIDKNFSQTLFAEPEKIKRQGNNRLMRRLQEHSVFIGEYETRKGALKHVNKPHGFAVVTRQETGLAFYEIIDVVKIDDFSAKAIYNPLGLLGPGKEWREVNEKDYLQPGLFAT